MERKKYLIVTAGGSGTRMGADVPKQFLNLGGKYILHVTLEKFFRACPDIRVITVLPEAHIDRWKAYCREKRFIHPQTLLPGGITRFHSVKNGLSKVPDGALVAVHDGVRPLVTEAFIGRLFGVAETNPAVVPVLPCTDTLKAVVRKEGADGQKCLEGIPGVLIDRNAVYRAQTPQVFHSEILKSAYDSPFDLNFTDDASVVEKNGTNVTYVDGEQFNIKITTPDDLILAEAVYSRLLPSSPDFF